MAKLGVHKDLHREGAWVADMWVHGPTCKWHRGRGGRRAVISRRRLIRDGRGGHHRAQERMAVLPRGFSSSAGGRSYVSDVRRWRELIRDGEEGRPVRIFDGESVG